jgi:hypothetical protein
VGDTSRVEIARVDPRDETWEVDLPLYRVYFWDAEARSDEYELSGAEDVAEIIRWAESDSDGRSFTVYACVPGDGVGLVRVAGTDPTRS